MAGAILGSVPIVILYVFFLDYYVSGLNAGAIKSSPLISPAPDE
jgi:ABC-type maltose transport system permease subunit